MYQARKKQVLFILLGVFALSSLSMNKPPLILSADSVVRINKNYDLQGQSLQIPSGVTLKFVMGGCISNGTIVGNNTKIVGRSNGIFDRVIVQGSWDVPVVSPTMFKRPYEIDVLKQVFALTNDCTPNTVYIPKGTFTVQVGGRNRIACSLRSKTEVVLDGNIVLSPNSLIKYYILDVSGCSDVVIRGSGNIIGDKFNHLSEEGEWGHGINVMESSNVVIRDLTIKDCWGDCVYVGGESQNVFVDSCIMDNGRRQGLSITSANGVCVTNCYITNVSGTIPQCAIDIETNEGTSVDNIIIDSVVAENCYGGFQIYGVAKDSRIRNVSFNNCRVLETSSTYSMMFIDAERVVVNDCIIDSKEKVAILFQDIEIASCKGNTITSSNSKPIRFSNCKSYIIE